MGSLAAIPFWYLMTFLPWQLYSLVVMFGDSHWRLSFAIRRRKHMGATTTAVLSGMNLSWYVDNADGVADDGLRVAAVFVIFRILAGNPSPIRWFDRNAHGGIGDYDR